MKVYGTAVIQYEFTNQAIDIINPATKYVVLRASSLPLIKAWLAGNGCSISKSHNAEQGPA
jgi:hypothetical protein